MNSKEGNLGGAIHERNYVYNFHFHLIWVTKYRNPAFTTPKLVNDMKAILERIASLNEVTIERMEVMPDHVHLLINFKPKYTPTTIVKAFKGASARMFFDQHPEVKAQKFWGGHLWSHSYYMSTLGDMSREVVERYIENQRTTPGGRYASRRQK
ncbi:IS200/IS605 family transposase [Lacticaseibacillus sp. N501-2]|uniref:IS200/IS605 family transposase n=1 Tax=Lacticaseibacillus salsurae TaxID=3367729 RepID=UPI0038B40635